MRSIVTLTKEDEFVKLMAKVNSPPGSGSEVGVPVFTSLVAETLAVSTRTGMLNVLSQLHFEGEPGAVSSGPPHTMPEFWDQLVQFGRFSLPSPSVSWQETLSTRTVTIRPFGGPHPLAVVTSRHVSPSRFAAYCDPSVTIWGDAGSV